MSSLAPRQAALFGEEHNDGSRDNWATPRKLVDELREEFPLVLDVAALEHNAKCPHRIGPERDSLTVSWANELNALPTSGGWRWWWCNPPFSQLELWTAKASAEQQAGASGVMILPANRTGMDWWHDNVVPCAELRWLRGRVAFVPPPGVSASSPMFACVLAIYRGYTPDLFGGVVA